jgi:hypothetical protein
MPPEQDDMSGADVLSQLDKNSKITGVNPIIQEEEKKPEEQKTEEKKPEQVQQQQKKVQKTAEQNIAQLRKDRDGLAEVVKGYNEVFGETFKNPSDLKPIVEFLIDRNPGGVITSESITELIE